jgi:hypothetical protein
MKARKYSSSKIKELLKEMNNDSLITKLIRRFKLIKWTIKCMYFRNDKN